MAKKDDILAIVARIEGLVSDSLSNDNPTFSQSPAVKVINSVLSLGMNYKRVVEPKLNAFAEKHRDVKQVSELATFIARYPTPIDFLTQEFNYKNTKKNITTANAIAAVADVLCDIINASPTLSEEEALKRWAIQAQPQDYRSLGIKGFKLAGFQWLRMLFGAETTKPDVHINRFLRDTLNRDTTRTEAILLIEKTAEHLEIPARNVDRLIWRKMSKK